MQQNVTSPQVYEEASSDFHQVAYFRTRIGLRNALQEEISGSSDKEAVLITLNRPIVFAQPVAFDRGSASSLTARRSKTNSAAHSTDPATYGNHDPYLFHVCRI